MRRGAQGGFTLLEAIVAMTVFATSALGLYAWINSMMIGTARFDAIVAETTDLENAVEYLSVVNPMLEPSGSRRLGEMVLNWESELVEPERRGNLVGNYQFGLYELAVSLRREGAPIQTFKLRQVGFRPLATREQSIGI